MHGSGILNFGEGSFYRGEFQNGVYHGNGVLKSLDGSIRKGNWENGVFMEK